MARYIAEMQLIRIYIYGVNSYLGDGRRGKVKTVKLLEVPKIVFLYDLGGLVVERLV